MRWDCPEPVVQQKAADEAAFCGFILFPGVSGTCCFSLQHSALAFGWYPAAGQAEEPGFPPLWYIFSVEILADRPLKVRQRVDQARFAAGGCC
jgi:hypothetical protein